MDSDPERDIFQKPLDVAMRHALSYLADLDSTPVAAPATVAALRERLNKDLLEHGLPADEVISQLIADCKDGLNASAGGRFFGWVIGGSLPSALAADWLTSTWDQNAGTYATAPAAAVVEEVVGKWLKSLFGLPETASFALVTGCQMAHATCLAAARHALLTNGGWDVERDGLYGAPQVQILTSPLFHGTVPRALRLLGMGTAHIKPLASDSSGRLSPHALEAALANAGAQPAIVLLQAGDVNTGTFDDFETLIPIARRHGAWVHVDGAFGLWVAASPHRRDLVKGVAEADSWATDGHKWLNVPYDCGYAIVANEKAHQGAMGYRASYISYSAEVRDQTDFTPEFSRRARGFATYAAIRELGRAGIADLIDRCCEHAREMTLAIAALPGAELVAESAINQGLVRFLDNRPRATPEDQDRRTDNVIAQLCARGEVLFSGTTWKERRAMRISVSSWRTSSHDVERSVRAVEAVLRGQG